MAERRGGKEDKPGCLTFLARVFYAKEGEERKLRVALVTWYVITRSEGVARGPLLGAGNTRAAFVGMRWKVIFESHVSRAVDKMRH